MEKAKQFIKRKIQGMSVKLKFAVYMAAGLLISTVLAGVLSASCQGEINRIYLEYQGQREELSGRVIDENGQEINTIHYYMTDVDELLSTADRRWKNFLDFMQFAVVPLSFLVGVVATSVLFYRHTLKRPLEILDHAAVKIARQELDFQVVYEKDDELGRLCASFERMRAALLENNRRMWRTMEERKRLNAAFSHDLRTPLTVLKGQSDLMIRYVPEGKMSREKIVSVAQTMKAHILRLENYVAAMTHVQKLEDLEACAKEITFKELCGKLQECGEMLAESAEVSFRWKREPIRNDTLFIDEHMVMEVFENLVSNAFRYGRSYVEAELSCETYLVLTVRDDGPGFAKEVQKKAAQPFYQAGKARSAQHLGMGLYISDVLCRRHGGELILDNRKEGPGAEVRAVFSILSPDSR